MTRLLFVILLLPFFCSAQPSFDVRSYLQSVDKPENLDTNLLKQNGFKGVVLTATDHSLAVNGSYQNQWSVLMGISENSYLNFLMALPLDRVYKADSTDGLIYYKALSHETVPGFHAALLSLPYDPKHPEKAQSYFEKISQELQSGVAWDDLSVHPYDNYGGPDHRGPKGSLGWMAYDRMLDGFTAVAQKQGAGQPFLYQSPEYKTANLVYKLDADRDFARKTILYVVPIAP